MDEIRFWRTTDKKEVDFVVRREGRHVVPVEVKCRHMAKPEIGTPLRAFIRQYSPSHAIVANRDLVEETTYEGTLVIFLPLWMM